MSSAPRWSAAEAAAESSAGEALAEPQPRRTRALFVTLMVAGSSIALVKGLAYAKVLDPGEYGYYGLVALVLQFGLHLSNWGILSALNNHLPIAFGKGRRDQRDLLERSLGALVFSAGLTSAVYLAIVLALPFGDTNVKIALALGAGTSLIGTLLEFHALVLRVRHEIVPLGLAYFSRASMAIALGSAGGILFGYRGVIVAEIIAFLAVIALTRRFWLSKLWIAMPSRRRVLDLVHAGWPLMASNLIVAATLAGDRVFVAAALPDELGQYVFATLIVMAWISILAMLEQVAAPRLLHNYGAGMRLREVHRAALKLVAMVLVPGLAGLGVLLAVQDPLARGFLAEYSAGLDVLPILYLGGLTLVMTFPGFVLSPVRPIYLTIATGAAALVTVVGGLIISAGDPDLRDFGWLFVASQATALVLITAAVEFELRRDPSSPDLFGR